MSDGENQQLAARQVAFAAKLEAGTEGDTALMMYQPRGFEALMKTCQFLAASSLVPQGLQGKPQDIAVIAMRGWEEKLPLIRSLHCFHAMFGGAVPKADYIRARCVQHKDVKLFQVVSADAVHATVRVQRHGWDKPIDVTYTVEQAKKAGYWDRKNSMWPRDPESMCVARATSVAARRHVPEVMAGLMSYEEAVDAGMEGDQPPQQPTARQTAAVQAATEAFETAVEPPAKEPEPEVVVDAEVVEEPPGEELDPAVIAKTVAMLVKEVAGMGQKNSHALIDAGYTSLEKIVEATEKDLQAVPGIGAQSATALKSWAVEKMLKRNGKVTVAIDEPDEKEPPEEEAPYPDDEKPYRPPPDRQVPPVAPGLKHRPIFHADPLYLKGMGDLCVEHGVFWSELEKKAEQITGGYSLDRANVEEWERLTDWVKSGTQEKLPAPKEEGEGPWWKLSADVGEETISQRQVERLLKYSSKSGVDLTAELKKNFGVKLHELPAQLYVAVLDLAVGEQAGWIEALKDLKEERLISEAEDDG